MSFKIQTGDMHGIPPPRPTNWVPVVCRKHPSLKYQVALKYLNLFLGR